MIWTHEQFEEMSWHDNHVHGLRIVEGSYGAGELHLDLDYILEWICGEGSKVRFRIVPALLRFRNVTHLRIELDYATPSAALAPFSIHEIRRSLEPRERYVAKVWEIDVSWPKGRIAFEADGFEQTTTAQARVVDEQFLSPRERAAGG